jgi:hypothetical protein
MRSERKRIAIEDDSDCVTCTARHEAEFEMLTEVKCDILEDIVCRECGRTITIFVEATSIEAADAEDE